MIEKCKNAYDDSFLPTRKKKAIYFNSNLNDVKPLPSTTKTLKGFRHLLWYTFLG